MGAYEQGIADALADCVDSSRRNDRRYISGVREGLARWLAFLGSTEDHTGRPPVTQLIRPEYSLNPASYGHRIKPILPPDTDANIGGVPNGWNPPTDEPEDLRLNSRHSQAVPAIVLNALVYH